MHDDLINNRFLRNAERKEYSAVASLKWQPDEHWELLAGGRWNRVDVHDRNRLATPDAYEVQGQYRYTELLNGNPALPSWRAKRIALLNWYPDANGNFTRESLLASPYKKGTVGDIGGWNFYDAGKAQDWKCRSAGPGRSRSAVAITRSRRPPAWPTASAKTPWST